MKIIFLDIDGVLCIPGHFGPIETRNLGGHMVHTFNTDCVQRLNKIVDVSGASIVISSAWRIDFWASEEFEMLKEFLKSQGMTGNVIDHTPYDDEGIRGREIQTWLTEHPEVKKFVIIDDSNDMEHLMPYLVRTQFFHGIQDEHIDAALKMLEEP